MVNGSVFFMASFVLFTLNDGRVWEPRRVDGFLLFVTIWLRLETTNQFTIVFVQSSTVLRYKIMYLFVCVFFLK